jgi:REP element-mobilizing transposase RayT
MPAWNDWYHVQTNTYGTWLPGDPRGWREKRHRRHVDGDYRDPPPPGSGDALHRRAKSLLKKPPVWLDAAQRETVGRAVIEMLRSQEIDVLVVSMDSVHLHLLARFSDRQVRPRLGRAKKHACFRLREVGFEGKLWERGCHAVPIKDRKHQINVFHYIRRHASHGAWVWTFRDGTPWLDAKLDDKS